MIKDRVERTGDGTHVYSKTKVDGNNNDDAISENLSGLWGWGNKLLYILYFYIFLTFFFKTLGDIEMTQDHKKYVTILNRSSK